MRPEMWAVITCPFSSCTRNMVLGKVSWTVPSISMTSSLAMRSAVSGTRPWRPRKRRSMPRPGVAHKGSSGGAPEVLVELAPDLLLDHPLERRKHQAKLRRDVDRVRAHRD